MIEYSEFNQYITLQNYPLLTTDGVLMDYCKEKVTDFLVENCPLLKTMKLLSDIIEAQQLQGTEHVLKHIRAVGFDENYYTYETIDLLAVLANGTYEGLDSSGLAGDEQLPVLDGRVTVHSKYYQDSVDALRAVFNRLELILDGESAIRFKDTEVLKVLVANAGMGDMLSRTDLAGLTSIGTWFKGNTLVRRFDELEYCTGLTKIADEAFSGCVSLRKVTLPAGLKTIGQNTFTRTSNT